MRWLGIGFLLLACILPLAAEDWTTADGHVYHNVTVVGPESDGVRITYDGGVGKIPYYLLPVDIQKKFGQDVDSLAAKKRAVDKAIEDAVRAAADAQITAAPVVMSMPSGGGAPAPGPGGAAPGPSATPGATPGTASNTSAPNPNKPAPTGPGPAPVVPVTVGPGAHPGPGAVPPATPTPTYPMPVSRTPNPGVNGIGGKPLDLAVANYTYNDALDVCYLDSPPIDIYLLNQPIPPPGQGSSLTLRIVTDGRVPQQPDRFEMTVVCVGAGSDLAGTSLSFLTDTGTITVEDTDRKDSGSLPGGGKTMRYASFYLSAAQVRQFAGSKHPGIMVGLDNYNLDDRGTSILRSYLGDVDTLQPATSSFMHSFYKLMARIPSFFSIISTVCEYVILGSFGLLVAASIAAFILGITRFIKM
jgi:hypothetical protein